jgi:hypothetical protein
VREKRARAPTELQEVVEACLEHLETEGMSALESACAAHPELAAELRRRIARLRRLGLLEIEEDRGPSGPRDAD